MIAPVPDEQPRSTADSLRSMAPRLLSMREAAEVLGIPLRTLYRLKDVGTLPVIPIGQTKGFRIDVCDLADMLDALRTSNSNQTEEHKRTTRSNSMRHVTPAWRDAVKDLLS